MLRENVYCRNYIPEQTCENCKNIKVSLPFGDYKCKLKNHYIDKGMILTCDDYKNKVTP